MSAVQQALLMVAAAAGGGGAPALVQSTSVNRGIYTNGAVTFGSAVTAGNTIIVYGASTEDAPTVTTSQSDTVVQNVITSGQYRVLLAYVNVANGGSTTVTMASSGVNALYAEEWENIEYNAAAGVGTTTATAGVTASTPNASTVATAVSFSTWGVAAGGSYATQAVASGFTEGDRYTNGPGFDAYTQFIGAYRAETTTGVKSAAWPDPAIFPDDQMALVMVFGQK